MLSSHPPFCLLALPACSFPSSSSLRLGTFNVGLGFLRKLPEIASRSLDLQLDVLALQEIGDPALLSTKLAHYNLVYAAGPSQHEAGVGLLISHDLASRCRAYKRSSTGRLVGVVLELSKGQLMLIVCAYMPSGLDHRSASDDRTQQAHTLYREMLRWTIGMQQVVVMGDLNETLTAHDRRPPPAAARMVSGTPIGSGLLDTGFTDVYRHLHPSAQRQPGFTHAIDMAARSIRSRIDYIWTRSIHLPSLLSARIDTKLHLLSHHHLLWMRMELVTPLPAPHSPLLRMRLPNLRQLSDEARQRFQQRVEAHTKARDDRLLSIVSIDEPTTLSHLAAELTTLTHDTAFSSLPITGATALQSKSAMQWEHQRRDLTRLMHTSNTLLQQGDSLTHSPEWNRLHRHCQQHYQLHWSIDVHYSRDTAGWLAETHQLIHRARCGARREKARMVKAATVQFDASPAATVHHMLQSDALPSQLSSVIDSSGALTNTAAEMHEVMASHFESVFALPAEDAAPMRDPPAMLFDKAEVQREWYDGLMVDVEAAELMSVLQHVPLVSAPGQDEVSTGVWKLALEGSEHLRKHVCSLFTACLRTSTFPAPWKHSVIIPFIKDAHKERAMSNVRPISLQACLGKLFSKLLAHRLGNIFARHPILNPSQRGFIPGGTTAKCIDELLDAWSWSREGKHELHTLLYDIKQAYDSVQTHVLVRAMQRLRMPQAFIDLITASLSDLTSCVRTVYGHTRSFAVRRSLRQGDPLAPLLFVVLVDALHDGLLTNPFTGKQHGCTLRWGALSVYLPSLGYADDTAVLSNSLADLRVQNDWVQYFMLFNQLRLNPLKCELIGRMAGGSALSLADVAAHDILIDGHIPSPLRHDQPTRYLGAHVSADGSWSAQISKSRATVLMFTRAMSKFAVPLKQARYMLHVFLLPKLELALHYVHGPGTSTWIRQCDSLLIGCIKHAVASPIRLSHTAVACALGLRLPSWMEVSVKVSELFVRMNSSDPRWGQLGRITMRQQFGSTIDAHSSTPTRDTTSQLGRTVYLIKRRLAWSLHLSEHHRAASRHLHLLTSAPLDSLAPTLAHCSSTQFVPLTGPGPSGISAVLIAHDLWIGWGGRAQPQDVHVYTDGSFDPASDTSAWSMAVADHWLNTNFATVPDDEHRVSPAHVGGSTLLGAAITCTHGVYPAELQAIARALATFPLSFHLHVHSDSKASIAAIASFERQCNERKRARMAARPLLQLISRHLAARVAAGGSASFAHVAAHTADMDIHSVGNRLADYQANRARTRPDRSCPLDLRQIPLTSCESHLHVLAESGLQIIDDLRRKSASLRREQAMSRWASKPEQGLFACAGMVDLGVVVLREGSPTLQCTFVHIATNSIHFYWPAGRGALLQQLQCAACACTFNLLHLTTCPTPAASTHRQQLQQSIVDLIDEFGSAAWLRDHRHLPADKLAQCLIPPSRAALDDPEPHALRLHTTRCLLGAFSTAEGTAMLSALRITDPKQRRIFLSRLRLLCLEHIDLTFTALKPPR